MRKRLQILLFSMAAVVAAFLPAHTARADEVIKIYEAADLEQLRTNPSGSFILMNDIDMKDVKWTPAYFNGKLDGDGHAIMNLEVTDVTTDTKQSVDGNMKKYDTVFSGFFGIVEDAQIKNLSLLGTKVDVTVEKDAFLALLAGYTYNTKIDNCTIEGTASLTVTGKMFGVGGAVGFGGKTEITNTTLDVTLINIDVDATTRDEQFLGGIYGNGYIDVDKCTVKLDGYTSDHGYVHDGGVTGMYIVYDIDPDEHHGFITNTKVTTDSAIHFFEDNTSRRAYCRTYVGETMHWVYDVAGNAGPEEEQGKYVGKWRTSMADEKFEYDKNLLPHDCVNPTYSSSEVTDGDYKYSLFKCSACDYTYKGDYVATREHIKDPNAPVIEETQAESESDTMKPEESIKTDGKTTSTQIKIAIAIIIVLVILIIVLLIVKAQQEKKRRARRRAKYGDKRK